MLPENYRSGIDTDAPSMDLGALHGHEEAAVRFGNKDQASSAKRGRQHTLTQYPIFAPDFSRTGLDPPNENDETANLSGRPLGQGAIVVEHEKADRG
jgi:hypothetical protein